MDTARKPARRKCRRCDQWMGGRNDARTAAPEPNHYWCTQCVEEQGRKPTDYTLFRHPGDGPDGTPEWIVEWRTLGVIHGRHAFSRREDAVEWLERAHAAIVAGTFVDDASLYVTPKVDCPTCCGKGLVKKPEVA